VEPQRAAPALDQIIRIRAIQNFSPSQAVAFVFFLKTVIREALEEDIKQSGIKEELLVIETRIDQLALLAFDQYMVCREKLYDLKANEPTGRPSIVAGPIIGSPRPTRTRRR
jgi:hypothetical protein